MSNYNLTQLKDVKHSRGLIKKDDGGQARNTGQSQKLEVGGGVNESQVNSTKANQEMKYEANYANLCTPASAKDNERTTEKGNRSIAVRIYILTSEAMR